MNNPTSSTQANSSTTTSAHASEPVVTSAIPTVTPISVVKAVPANNRKASKAVPKSPIKAAAKPVAKPAVKPSEKPATAAKAPVKVAATVVKKTPVNRPTTATTAAKPTKPVKAAPVVSNVAVDKPKKAKLVRDSFTIPKAEYELLSALKDRAVRLKQPAKKSELLRAGIKLMVSLTDAVFAAALKAIPALKTGRPKTEVVATKTKKAARPSDIKKSEKSASKAAK